MSSNGLVERFSVGKATEVERGTPSIFVKIGCEVVVAMRTLLAHAAMKGTTQRTVG